MKLSDFAAQYAAQRDVCEEYVEQIAVVVRSFDRHLGHAARFDDLTADAVNSWLSSLRVGGLAPGTRHSRRRVILTLWQAAADRDMVSEPRRRLIAQPRRRDRLVRAWSEDEVCRLLVAAEQLSGPLGATGIDAGLYWSSYVRAAWDTGLRGCDLRSLERGWISPTGRLQIVQHKTGGRLTVALRRSTLDAIARSFPPDRRLIWPRWCCLRYWRVQARRLVRSAGLIGSLGQLRAASGTAVERAHPGRGHEHLGNSRRVFERHYLDPLAVADPPLPPELTG